MELPDSHDAGDFGQFLTGAEHDWGLDDEVALDARTDGHMDINAVRAGATLARIRPADGCAVPRRFRTWRARPEWPAR